MTTSGLLDTSVFIAWETARALDVAAMPDDLSLSVVTLAELHMGIYSARDTETRGRRMTTLDNASQFAVLDIDGDAAIEWSRMRYRLAETGRRTNVNDLWIAAVALVHGLPVITQDGDFDAFEEVGGPVVIRV